MYFKDVHSFRNEGDKMGKPFPFLVQRKTDIFFSFVFDHKLKSKTGKQPLYLCLYISGQEAKIFAQLRSTLLENVFFSRYRK